MESKRQQRISKLIQHDLGEIFLREVPHLTPGVMVTVTKVHVTPDLALAKVYLSLFPTKDKETLLAGINKASREVRGLLGQRVRHQLRAIPELRFYLDDSLDYIEKIDKLLHEDENETKQ
jgi:ribosome-binding factor A